MNQRVVILGKQLAALRRERYLTQEEFAQRLEMSAANVRRLEQSGAGGMHVRNFRKLATLLKIEPDDLRRQIGAAGGMDSAHTEVPPAELNPARAPSALKPGTIAEAVEVAHYHGVSAARLEVRTDARRGRAVVPAGSPRRFAATIDGDCMEPRYCDGDVVVFSVDAAEREGIVEGKNYFIQFNDDENTFKRIFLDPDHREQIILRCWNERYPARTVERKSVKLLARAIYKLTPDE